MSVSATRTDEFFEALYGDAAEGPYDILLKFKGENKNTLHFEFQLKQRPGRCLACNLTYGLPVVFSRIQSSMLRGWSMRLPFCLMGKVDVKVWQTRPYQGVVQ